jgi:DNA-binding response OmpR family regulator
MAVLIVEDNPEVRTGLTRILTRSGFDVDQAENGLVALARLQHRAYQAIICDLMMPVMDGIRLYELLAHQYPETARRVLFVSAWFDDADVRGFLERSGRPVLRKPFDIDEFVRTVRTVAAQEPTPV